MMIIKFLIICSVSFYGSLMLGQIIAKKKPNSKFGKWWREQVINECEKCD